MKTKGILILALCCLLVSLIVVSNRDRSQDHSLRLAKNDDVISEVKTGITTTQKANTQQGQSASLEPQKELNKEGPIICACEYSLFFKDGACGANYPNAPYVWWEYELYKGTCSGTDVCLAGPEQRKRGVKYVQCSKCSSGFGDLTQPVCNDPAHPGACLLGCFSGEIRKFMRLIK